MCILVIIGGRQTAVIKVYCIIIGGCVWQTERYLVFGFRLEWSWNERKPVLLQPASRGCSWWPRLCWYCQMGRRCYVYFLPLTSSIWCLTVCSAPFIAQAACKTPPPWLWTAFTLHLFCASIYQTAYKTFTHTLSHWVAVGLRFSISLKVTLAHPTIRELLAQEPQHANVASFPSCTFLSAV